MEFETLEDLYLDQLRDLYSAEQQLIKALPKMAKAAHSSELRQALEEHLEQTKQQKTRLENIFAELDEKASGETCEAMEGLIEEGEEIINSKGAPAVLDAGIIAAAQRVEHYEIAAYGTARAFAHQLGYDDAADLLQQTLDEEGQANKILNDVAERQVNLEAVEEDLDEDEEFDFEEDEEE